MQRIQKTLQELALLLLRPEAKELEKRSLEGDIPVEDWIAPYDELIQLASYELQIDPGALSDNVQLAQYLSDGTLLSDELSMMLYELENRYLWLTWSMETESMLMADKLIDLMSVSVFLSGLLKNPFDMPPDELRDLYQAVRKLQVETKGNLNDVMKPYREVLVYRLTVTAEQRSIKL